MLLVLHVLGSTPADNCNIHIWPGVHDTSKMATVSETTYELVVMSLHIVLPVTTLIQTAEAEGTSTL